jgi:HAD superfamily hydrolase (TIGR01549 family)
MIDAVIFDWGGTLAPWVTIDHLAGWRAYADVVHPGDATAAERAATALLAAENGRWRRVREEHRAFTLAQVVADATEALGGPALPYREDALTAFREFWTVATHTHAEVAPTLSRLRERGLALGVLSSTGWPGTWHEEFLRRDGVLELFDACVWTSDLDWTKPHPEAFRAAMAAVGATDPARCVYVGDRPYDDIAGAKGIGMRAVFVPHSVIPLDQQVPVDVEPDAVIQRLSELPELLATW